MLINSIINTKIQFPPKTIKLCTFPQNLEILKDTEQLICSNSHLIYSVFINQYHWPYSSAIVLEICSPSLTVILLLPRSLHTNHRTFLITLLTVSNDARLQYEGFQHCTILLVCGAKTSCEEFMIHSYNQWFPVYSGNF